MDKEREPWNNRKCTFEQAPTVGNWSSIPLASLGHGGAGIFTHQPLAAIAARPWDMEIARAAWEDIVNAQGTGVGQPQ